MATAYRSVLAAAAGERSCTSRRANGPGSRLVLPDGRLLDGAALGHGACTPPLTNHTLPYNAAGWIPTIVANVPPLIWFLAVSVAMIRWTDAPEG